MNLDERLLAEAKRRAAEEGTTLGGFIEDALREVIARRQQPRDEPVRLPTVGGGTIAPGLDLNDNAAVLDFMEREE